MPYKTICGAKLYYETFGVPKAGQAPILLVHGSTQTGASCWNKVAPLLANDYHVIVPDCRGHGRSENPRHTYSFHEMAADLATLIRDLGFERAHVIGHSNGGNIAIVMMMEHPEVIQTCISQAGNAWLTPQLIERERIVFTPDYIAEHDPEWMKEVVTLHEPFHGQGYARALIELTLEEMIREPNYTPQQMSTLALPVLFIQGEQDGVNAHSRFAQRMARAVPFAEVWIPAGVGHNVHDEILSEWLARVRDFLSRRGTPEGEQLYRFRKQRFPDDRIQVFDVRVGVDGKPFGVALTETDREQALSVLQRSAEASGIRVLITSSTPWALLNRPVEDLRRKPSILSERISQARLGEAARVLEVAEGWSKIRLEQDGYMGWVHTVALFLCDEVVASAYVTACNAIVCVPLAEARNADGSLAQKIPFAVRLPLQGDQVTLPDGRRWWVHPQDFMTLAQAPRPDETGITLALDLLRRFVGVPYLWGGRTPYGFDCSGLAGTFYAFLGITIPRDADQQFQAGRPVDGTPQAGDLLFFGEPDEDGDIRISHVAISLGGDEFIHANGASWGVSYNSFRPSSPLYREWLTVNYRGARRFP